MEPLNKIASGPLNSVALRLSVLLAATFSFAWTSLAQETQATATATEPEPEPEVLRLWIEDAPGALGQNDWDIPTLTHYAAKDPNGAAMVICPGGGYGGLAGHEGKDYALWLNEHGVTCFVLKYRLGSKGYRHPVMWGDVSRAIRWTRAHAETYGIDPHRIGVMGSSAGGHLASTILTHFDEGDPDDCDPVERVSSRPDLGVLCYAVISMKDGLTHAGSKRNLLGENPDSALVELLSNELQVTPGTPPTFLWSTVEDPVVKVENSMEFAGALRKSGVPFAMSLYDKGRHGIGLAGGHPWTQDLLRFFEEREFLKSSKQ